MSHLIREVESALRAVLVPLAPEVPGRGESENHKRSIAAIISALDIPSADPVGKEWLKQAGSYQGRAHRRNLAEPAPFNDAFIQYFDDFQGILDYVLDKAEAKFAAIIVKLDELAVKTHPVAEDVGFLLTSVPQSPVTLGRFFERISDPAWLPLLRRKDVFAKPPEPEEHDGTVSFPPWPPMQYLLKMAPIMAVEVTEIVRNLPATGNASVNAQLVAVARALPTDRSAELLPRLIETLDSQYRLVFPDQLAELMASFTIAGDTTSALRLARSMLTFDDPEEDEQDGASPSRSRREPVLRIDEHTYGEILHRHMPPLAAAAGVEAIELMVELLEISIIDSSSPHMIESREDHSSIWRKAISSGGLGHDHDTKNQLTTALRESIAARVSQDPEDLQRIVGMLEARGWPIFHRLALDLLCQNVPVDGTIVGERLTDRANFDDAQLRSEYDRLLSARFEELDIEDQAKILTMIEQGPPGLDSHAKWVREAHGYEPTPEELQTYMEVWQRDRLSPIADDLPDGWGARYDALVARNGPPRPRTPAVGGGGFISERSPATPEELAALEIDELVNYLTAFEPSSEFPGPSKRGLSLTLTDVVAAEPDRYLAAGRRLGDLAVDYVQAIVNGVQRAVSNGKEINWNQVLDLCEAIVDHPRPPATDEGSDNGWGWARLDVMRLLSQGFASSNPPTDNHRRRIFVVIATVASDPNPSPDDEERYGSSNNSPDLSLNCVRPRAIEAVMRYGVWVYQRHPNDAFIEVTELVAKHLDPREEPSVAVRSVLGSHFGNLVAFNQEFAAQAASRVFPDDERYRALWEAAWGGHLARGMPNRPTWKALQAQYALAVARLEGEGDDGHKHGRTRALGNHLVHLYLAGELRLEDGLIAEFFDKADEEVRRQILEWIGRWLAEEDTSLEPPLLDRLLALWDSRIAAARAAPTKELSAYGWWFCSPRLTTDRRVCGLRDALALSGSVEPAHLVVEHLAALSSEDPRSAAELLVEMVNREENGWRFAQWDESARTIIHNAQASPFAFAQEAAQHAASRAAARGHLAWLEFE
ncbi:hypothetical protein [Arthrobacter sp. 92]|uniref:hypothetical protein n=1 Tax=Arthrobacter sp. 92 TaxID=3418175 RepID=UPI003D0159A2